MIKFLTFQTLILVTLKIIYDIEFINLHFLTFFVLLGGCYITYIKQFLIIYNLDVSGKELDILNVLFHIIPFLIIWLRYDLKKKYILETYTYILCYYYIFIPENVYYLQDQNMIYLNIIIFIISILFYIII